MGVLVMLTLLAGVWQLRSKDPEPTPATGDATGAQDALLDARTVSDFQCPYCRQFWELTLPALKEEYIATGQIRLIFINLPLASIHPNAPAAHEFAMCSARQGLFWPVHDLLFQTQGDWKGLDDLAPFFMGMCSLSA
jgi:protein-disulfide isomerase